MRTPLFLFVRIGAEINESNLVAIRYEVSTMGIVELMGWDAKDLIPKTIQKI